MFSLVKFGRLLRREGLDIHNGRIVDLPKAIETIDIGNRDDFYYVCRILLIHRHEDIALFDQLFHQFWRKNAALENRQNIVRYHDLLAHPGSDSPAPQDRDYRHGKIEDREADRELPKTLELTSTYSAREALRRKDFAELTGEEIDDVKQLIAALVWKLGEKRTRRHLPGSGPRLDMRRTFRNNLRYGGEIMEWQRRSPKFKPRPLVILADISGSMERYTRMFLHFMYSLSWGLSQRVEVFVFSTRLSRITRQLRNRNLELALKDIAQHVPDWAGGTRIGAALKTFNFDWARRVVRSRAVVLFISDGWDRGDPLQMGLEMARLQRSCHRLIWLNPLLGSRDFEPRTRGTQAALGYVDDFLPVHNLSSLENLANYLALLTPKPSRR